jgi:Ca2+-binding EF-hand superfamily protein
MFETTEKKDEELWTSIFAEVDADGDGEITFPEFKAAMQRCFINSNSSKKYLIRDDTEDK